ncbi:MAG TPA: hypothetical protein VET26_10495 [Candidatus Sulfotelmatobacter sp.]|nr:hypothetical protein [Candidatus Sulfotelmatobacter sp.]
MLRWLLFFLLIVFGILVFVSFVMGVPVPFLNQFTPSTPFNPGNPM